MNEVFQKTRQLGEALLESQEYKAVKKAEQKAMSNPDAAKAVGRFIELRSEMEEIMRSDKKNWPRVQTLTEEMDALRQAMGDNDDLIALDQARGAFQDLINQVNQVLHFIVTGEMDGSKDSCAGDCASCGGCSTRVN